MKQARHFKLEQNNQGSVRFLSGLHVQLQEGVKTSVVTITRTGTFTDPRYGSFEISKEMLLSMVKNFDDKVYGQEIFFDVAHKASDGAAAKVLSLRIEGNRLRAQVEWTPFGIKAVKDRGFVYLSAEFHEDFVDNEAGQSHGATLLGAGLTIRPVIKGLDTIQLAEEEGAPRTYLHPTLIKELTESRQEIMNKFLTALRKKLEQKKLSEEQIVAVLKAAGAGARNLAEDDTETHNKLLAEYDTLADSIFAANEQAGKAVTLNLSVPDAPAGLDAAAVKKLLSEERAEQAAASKKLSEDTDSKIKTFSDAINAAEGLSDTTKKELCENVSGLIGANTTGEQVLALATQQIAMGNQLEAAKQLSDMGYQVAGSPRISVDEGNAVKSLQERYDTGLKTSSAYSLGGLKLSDGKKDHPFVAKMLSLFDQQHMGAMVNEHKQLASGQVGMADSSLPMGVQRTVIREALTDLNVLELVQTLTDATATHTTQIPYELRDVAAVGNDGVVYEGGGIHQAGISQKMDTAYINAIKLGLEVSNEVAHFSRTSGIDWDAYGRNVESNARFLRELVAKRIANTIQRTADSYLAGSVANEDVSAQFDGTLSSIKTVQFPIVRPHQVRDLTGLAVGLPSNPMTVTLGGTVLAEYNGTGTQAAGTYYRLTNVNLGYLQFVSETGAAVAPASATACTVSYDYATNLVKFDMDLPTGVTDGEHMNGLLRKIGARKAMMISDRYVTPDFLLQSPILNDQATNADQFALSLKRSGNDVSGGGDLEKIKNIAAYSSNATMDLGDERTLIGVRGTTTYTVAKAFSTGTPFEAVDATGKPTGKKVAYGEEYGAIHTPKPIANRYTSVLAYSFAGR